MGDPHSVAIGDAVFVGGGVAVNESDECTVMKFQRGHWTKLPEYSAHRFAMTSLDNQLVLVGGLKRAVHRPTNQIAVFESGKWIHPYPPMSIRRSRSTAVSFHNRIVVAGGHDQGKALSTVEVFDVASRTWYIAESMPEPLWLIKSTVIGDTLYTIGGCIQDATRSVFKANLTDLIDNAVSKMPTQSPWQRIEDTPLYRSAPLSVGGSLLAVGGRDDNPSSSIHLYQPDTKSWLKVGDLRTPQYNCTCSVLPNGEIIVAGGTATLETYSNTVYILTISN